MDLNTDSAEFFQGLEDIIREHFPGALHSSEEEELFYRIHAKEIITAYERGFEQFDQYNVKAELKTLDGLKKPLADTLKKLSQLPANLEIALVNETMQANQIPEVAIWHNNLQEMLDAVNRIIPELENRTSRGAPQGMKAAAVVSACLSIAVRRGMKVPNTVTSDDSKKDKSTSTTLKSLGPFGNFARGVFEHFEIENHVATALKRLAEIEGPDDLEPDSRV